MEKEFIPYKLALEMKELGFNESCFSYFYKLRGHWRLNHDYGAVALHPTNSMLSAVSEASKEERFAAPLWQQAFQWFRNKHNILGEIHWEGSREIDSFDVRIVILGEHILSPKYDDYKLFKDLDYERAQTTCLKELIRIVKKQKS